MEETIGARVKRVRESRGISQAELARRIHTSANAVNLLEQGTTYDPRVSRLTALALELNVSTDFLLGLTDDQRPRKRKKPADDDPDTEEAA